MGKSTISMVIFHSYVGLLEDINWFISHGWKEKPTPLKNMIVSWDDYYQYMEKI